MKKNKAKKRLQKHRMHSQSATSRVTCESNDIVFDIKIDIKDYCKDASVDIARIEQCVANKIKRIISSQMIVR